MESETKNKLNLQLPMVINPLFYWITVIYLFTRMIEWSGLIETEFWTRFYNKIIDNSTDDEYFFIVFGGTFIWIAGYWTVGGIYFIIDITQPSFALKYKTQPGTNNPLDLKKLWKACLNVLFNQTVVNISVGSLFYYLKKVIIGHPDLRLTQSFPAMMGSLIVISVIHEFMFYTAHRALHHPSIYKKFHKTHHEWTAPVAMVVLNTHWVEHVVCNLCSVTLPYAFLHLPYATGLIWFAVENIVVLSEHSGYHFPLLPTPVMHDYHHMKFNECFGHSGLFDWIHKTSQKFEKSIYGKRNKVCFSFTPSNELFPDLNEDLKKIK